MTEPTKYQEIAADITRETCYCDELAKDEIPAICPNCKIVQAIENAVKECGVNPRIPVSQETRQMAVTLLIKNLGQRLDKHGARSYAGAHEGLGSIAEEYDELLEAVRSNDPCKVINESLDIAVGCLWLVASLLEKNPKAALSYREVVKS